MREALQLVQAKLVAVIDELAKFAAKNRELPCLGFTHLQPAQPTTVGKRATLWCYDLVLDLAEIEHRLAVLKCRGVKGTTGTQASFVALFNGDHAKIEELDRRVSAKMGFDAAYAVTGQTYSRKVDAQVLDVLSGIGQSITKLALTFASCKAARKLKSRSRSSRSARRRWPTSGIRCDPSGCARSPGLR